MEELGRLRTGSRILDSMLDGGYERDVVTMIYGPPGSGKTVLCMLCVIAVARSGMKVVYVDTEEGFSAERLKQIARKIGADPQKIMKNIVFLRPLTFEEQKKDFEKLKELVNGKIGLVVVDSIAMLYRLELGKTDDVKQINKELGRQMADVMQIARVKKIPVLMTNQVYVDFDDREKIHMVGGDILRYQSKCLIELQIPPSGNRVALLRKHRSISEERKIGFRIVEGGVLGTRETR